MATYQAAYSNIDGIIFQDDMYINDFDDMSLAAQQAFKEKFHQQLAEGVLKNKAIRQDWISMKSKILNDITLELMKEVEQYRPRAKMARNK